MIRGSSFFAVKGETVIHQNGGAPSLNHSTESTEPDYVVVESQCQPVEAAVISEIPETTIQKEQVKKSKEEKGRLFGKMFKKKAEPPAEVKSVPEKEKSGEDQMDAGPPATEPQPVSALITVSRFFFFYHTFTSKQQFINSYRCCRQKSRYRSPLCRRAFLLPEMSQLALKLPQLYCK